MLPNEALVIGEIPYRLDVIQKASDLLSDVGGMLFGVDTTEDDIRWSYQFSEDGSRVFLDIVMDISAV